MQAEKMKIPLQGMKIPLGELLHMFCDACFVRCDGLHQAALQPKHQCEALLARRALLRTSTVP